MPYEKKITHQSDPYKRVVGNEQKAIRNVYWAEVVSIYDDTEGGRIQARIPDLDSKIANNNLPYSYPMESKFVHIYPKVGEVVRIFIEDVKYPQRSRFWMGPIISQLQKINFDPIYTALSTTNINFTQPQRAISSFPDAKGVFPNQEDIALLGRDNTDVILRVRDVEIRAGKHEYEDVFKLNKLNPASIRATYDVTGQTTISSSMIMADKIALISHEGVPKFKAVEIDQNERQRIFAQGHPLGRGDIIVQALELIRDVLINDHSHPYPNLPADKSGKVLELEKLDFTQILQRNIVIN
jgi:hypothetical protein